MNDEHQPTPIDQLVNRLAIRVGQLTAENEWYAVQLEQANAELEMLRGLHHDGPQPPPVDGPIFNGQTQEVPVP